MKFPLFMRLPFLGPALVIAALLVILVPMDLGPRARVPLFGFAALFLAYGFWSFKELFDTILEFADWFRTRKSPADRPNLHVGPLPTLTSAKKSRVRTIIGVLAEFGIFAPQVPDPEKLYAGVADYDGPIDIEIVLGALVEADYYHPDFNSENYLENLILHDSHREQMEDCLEQQIHDLTKLSGGALNVSEIVIDKIKSVDGQRTSRHHISMVVNGAPVTLDYLGSAKYLSTVIHHCLAIRLTALAVGKRFAWLWTDQGPWISCVADGAVEAINSKLKLSKRTAYIWQWVDKDEPVAAGQA